MEKENAQKVEKGEATEKDFPFTQAREEELKAKFSKEDILKLLNDEMEFNKEVQIFVLNQMNKRKLNDFAEQILAMDKYDKGGR